MDVSDWFMVWLNMSTHPTAEAFEQERKNSEASLSLALLWMLLAVVITGALALVYGMYQMGSFTLTGGMYGVAEGLEVPPEITDQFGDIPLLRGPLLGLGGAVLAILSTLLSFLISVGLLFLVARMLGGTGKFGRYAYLVASYSAPLTVVSALLGYIPYLGDIFGLLLVVYQAILTYFAVKVEHALSRRKAIIVVLSPFIVIALLVVIALLFTPDGNFDFNF